MPHRSTNWLMLGLLVALWGSAFAFARIAVESVAPEWTMAGRLIMGAALLLPLALGAGKMLPREGGHWRWLVGLALVGNIAPFFVISWGQQHVPSALAGILIGFTPLATLVIAHFLLAEERITRLRLTGFATGFAGLVIVLGPSALADMASGGDRLLGQLAVLAGAFFFACNNVMARLAPEMPLLVKSSGVMVAGAVAGTAIAGAVTPPAALASASAASLFGVAGLGIFSTGLAALVFFRLVDRAGPAFVSLTNYLVPVFASLAGFFVFGEELNFRILTGLSLILAGIAVSEWRATFKE
ncbi:DMT family transporter [Parvibaculum sp.]|uniref:DMT family transporter n=1 Tax=Parvibaculum sp. TaxID=2024848 RepID=UPI0038B247A0